jgi:hypothetical protein
MTRTMHTRTGLVIGAALLAATAGVHAQAQEARPAQGQQALSEAEKAQAELDRTPESCVLLNRVDRNVAANDRQVVFYMKGGKNYINVLDQSCPALKAGDYRLIFQYRTASAKTTRLCDYDGFTVEKQTSRVGCSLGKFIPITPEEAAALTAKPAAAPAASSSGNSQSGGDNRNQ